MRPVVACHCKMCRKTSGHYVAATAARLIDISIDGEPTWFESSPGHARGFCGTCGSSLFWRDASTDRISIFAGSLEAPTGLRMAQQIFVGEKGDYYEIEPGLPQIVDGTDARLEIPDATGSAS
ncbi:MAG: GFA family protein [Pseudomonadota bacterium]